MRAYRIDLSPPMQELLTSILNNPGLVFLILTGLTILLTAGLGGVVAFGAYLLNRENERSALPLVAPDEEVETLTDRQERRAIMPHRSAGPGAAIFTLIVILGGLLAGLLVRLMPPGASVEAGPIDLLFNQMLGISTAIFVLVESILIYAAIRFRRKKNDPRDGLPIQGSNRLEIAWTVIPTLIVLWLGTVSFQLLQDLRSPAPDAMVIDVISRQFQFEFYYPDLDRTTLDLIVPVDQPIRLKITSNDILHSFWVPAFRIKQDAIPRVETELFFTANKVGTYPIRCAELCGAGHAQMGFVNNVVVQQASEFTAWATGERAAVLDPVELFALYGCVACHELASANATGQVGPSLNGIGGRAANQQPGVSAEDYIRQSILMPNAYIVGGFAENIMPKDFGQRMDPPELDALVSYLLKEN